VHDVSVCCLQKDGEMLPGSKGIALTPEQFQAVKSDAAEISNALQSADVNFRLGLSSRSFIADMGLDTIFAAQPAHVFVPAGHARLSKTHLCL
jgi:hypothetical protein